MRVVLQRVTQASVTVDSAEVSAIGRGLVLLVGFSEGDGAEDLEWMASRIVGLRVFDDAEGRMNLSLREVDGALLVVSQFTLYGDTRKGRRPSFGRAAPPETAEPLYDRFVALLQDLASGRVEEGEFGAMMKVSLRNDGPVTLVIDRDGEGP